MSRKTITILTVLIALGSSSLVGAQRTFVSTSGLDTNPCTRDLPCRGFMAAVQQTLPGGEVYAVDSGGYGDMNLAQAVTIRADGVSVGISVFTGFDGVDINAGPADVVTLHGLTINGLGGNDGVSFQSGAALHLENVTVANMAGAGVEMTASGELDIVDSTFRDNWLNQGLRVHPSGAGSAIVSVDGGRFERNNTGISIEDGGVAVVRNSIAVSNQSMGFLASTNASGASVMMLESCVSSNNNYGVSAQLLSQQAQPPFVWISNVTVYGNAVGLETNNIPAIGGIYSFGNNRVDGNQTNGSPTHTAPRM